MFDFIWITSGNQDSKKQKQKQKQKQNNLNSSF